MSEVNVILKSYAKLNISLDVTGRRPDGYHNIVSLMQDVDLADDFELTALFGDSPDSNKIASRPGDISLKNNDFETHISSEQSCLFRDINVNFCLDNSTIPQGTDNLAMRGACAVIEAAPDDTKFPCELEIKLAKRLPIGAGIAGGSGNAAVAMLAVNRVLGNFFSLRELMELGAGIGADIPFSIMMNAKKNRLALIGLKGIEEASTAALVKGIGEIVEPTEPMKMYVILMNPGEFVSTAEAYAAIDRMPKRDSREYGLFRNIFEDYTYGACEPAKELRRAMAEHFTAADHIVMSGSGPTIAAYYSDEEAARRDYESALLTDWIRPECKIWYAISGGDTV